MEQFICKKLRGQVRNNKTHHRGYVVAAKRADGSIGVGYALHNPKDRFSKIEGKTLAYERAIGEEKVPLPIVSHTAEMVGAGIINMMNRCGRYFKDATEVKHCLEEELEDNGATFYIISKKKVEKEAE